MEPLLQYYSQQGLWKDDQDRSGFVDAISRPLPVTFRILKESIHTQWVRKFCEDKERSFEGKYFIKRDCVPGFEGFVYEVAKDRKLLKEKPALREAQQFLLDQSESGVLMRQELVSMLPATLLIRDLKKRGLTENVKLLDLCAAPGSKTSQLLEGLPTTSSNTVVANDLNSTRAHMLVHRLRYQASNSLLVTLHNAAFFPSIFHAETERKIFFDGVLADVPCSGDGTIRKAPGLLRTWSPNAGIFLHGLQMKILRRGLAQVAVGGMLVYSTCSFNPIENEAVVAGILRYGKGTIEIESAEFPQLKTRGGLTSWKVVYKGKEYSTADEVPENLKQKLFPSLFPAPESWIREELATKCIRMMPHDNDTGGFFIAAFRKKAPVPWEFKEDPVEEAKEDKVEEPETQALQQNDLLCLADRSDAAKELVFKPYGIRDTRLIRNMWSRVPVEEAAEKVLPRKIWFVSDGVRDFLSSSTKKSRLRVLHAGCQIIECREARLVRLNGFGFHTFLKQYMKEGGEISGGHRRMINRETLQEFICQASKAPQRRLKYEDLAETGRVREFLGSLHDDSGHYLLCCWTREGSTDLNDLITVPMFKARTNAELLVTTEVWHALNSLFSNL